MTQVFNSQATAETFRTSDKKTISVRFKNPVRIYYVNISNEAWQDIENNISNANYKIILQNALENSASNILRDYIKAFSVVPNDIPDELFAKQAIIDSATSGNSDWLNKEELENAWKNSATFKAFRESAKYRESSAYRKAFNSFEELILKLSGKSSQYSAKELDIILAKLNDEDYETDFGVFVVKRIESLRNKPEKNADMDLL